MGRKKILSIGVHAASQDVSQVSLDSKTSLLDWDIILFRPDISNFIYYSTENYQGKKCLSDDTSFKLRECLEYWRAAILEASRVGKVVVLHLPPLQEVFVATGTFSTSGSGRSQVRTRHVELITNYRAIPATLNPISTIGTEMMLDPVAGNLVSSYWNDFGTSSFYCTTLSNEKLIPSLTTKSGSKMVGTVIKSAQSNGALVLLPDIKFDIPEFIKTDVLGKKNWLPKGVEFSARYISSVVSLASAITAISESTPTPSWATASQFTLQTELNLKSELLRIERKIEKASTEKQTLLAKIDEATIYSGLLFEKGKPLELAILKALNLMGFIATQYKVASSEFDVVFESEEGRLLGEAEGKDSKAINVEKLRQLQMNIHEDLQRESVEQPAKPVLFGNAYRLDDPLERPDPFTAKCYSASVTSSTALVFTPDLFHIVKYLDEAQDLEYAKQCRLAILSAVGRVVFPTPPSLHTNSGQTTVNDVATE